MGVSFRMAQPVPKLNSELTIVWSRRIFALRKKKCFEARIKGFVHKITQKRYKMVRITYEGELKQPP